MSLKILVTYLESISMDQSAPLSAMAEVIKKMTRDMTLSHRSLAMFLYQDPATRSQVSLKPEVFIPSAWNDGIGKTLKAFRLISGKMTL
jgi:hypothetical protein